MISIAFFQKTHSVYKKNVYTLSRDHYGWRIPFKIRRNTFWFWNDWKSWSVRVRTKCSTQTLHFWVLILFSLIMEKREHPSQESQLKIDFFLICAFDLNIRDTWGLEQKNSYLLFSWSPKIGFNGLILVRVTIARRYVYVSVAFE